MPCPPASATTAMIGLERPNHSDTDSYMPFRLCGRIDDHLQGKQRCRHALTKHDCCASFISTKPLLFSTAARDGCCC
jgi:hypothetical protein